MVSQCISPNTLLDVTFCIGKSIPNFSQLLTSPPPHETPPSHVVPMLKEFEDEKLKEMMKDMKPMVFGEQSYIIQEGEPVE
uniref:Cyclic nucleotide-binding domain-containing protein n=1 Tax=Cucumis melo TaxID=3656 RepID=A0A9I9ECK4_CUCME